MHECEWENVDGENLQPTLPTTWSSQGARAAHPQKTLRAHPQTLRADFGANRNGFKGQC